MPNAIEDEVLIADLFRSLKTAREFLPQTEIAGYLLKKIDDVIAKTDLARKRKKVSDALAMNPLPKDMGLGREEFRVRLADLMGEFLGHKVDSVTLAEELDAARRRFYVVPVETVS